MPTSLVPGQKVPPLQVGLLSGQTFDISSEAPETFTVIYFYRGLHCPICKEQLEGLSGCLEDFSAIGAEPIAISMDSLKRARETSDAWSIDGLRLGYNLTAEDAQRWGLHISKAVKDPEPPYFTEPGVFIVRPDGTLYAQYLQSVPFARPRTDDLIAGLKFILENDYPARGTVTASGREAVQQEEGDGRPR